MGAGCAGFCRGARAMPFSGASRRGTRHRVIEPAAGAASVTGVAIDIGAYVSAIPARHRVLRFRTGGPFVVPAFAGALWHAVLGPALRAEACQAGVEACSDGPCRHPERCPFAIVMQSAPGGRAAAPLANVARVPGPLVFDTAPWRPWRLAGGEEFSIRFTMMGRVPGLADVAARALERAGEQGFGRDRVRATYLGGSEMIVSPSVQRGVLGGPLVLRAVTPLRLKRGGAFVREFDLAVLARDLSFRVAALGHYHGGLPWPAPWRAVAADAAAARIEGVDMRWVEAARFSARQERRIVLGGLIGQVELHDVGPSLRTLLAAGTLFHAGKGAALGLGQIAIDSPGGRTR